MNVSRIVPPRLYFYGFLEPGEVREAINVIADLPDMQEIDWEQGPDYMDSHLTRLRQDPIEHDGAMSRPAEGHKWQQELALKGMHQDETMPRYLRRRFVGIYELGSFTQDQRQAGRHVIGYHKRVARGASESAEMLALYDLLGCRYMFGDHFGNWISRAFKGKLKGARDVPPEKYLSLETILPADELPANVEEILEEHFYEWRRMANGAYYMKLWEDYSGQEDAYWAACKALGLQCYWPWPEEQSHDY